MQTKLILEALKNGESLSPIDALNRFGCFRLGARIKDLKDGKFDGIKYDIETLKEKNPNGKGYHARYRLNNCPMGINHNHFFKPEANQ